MSERCHYCNGVDDLGECCVYARPVTSPVTLCKACASKPTEVEALRKHIEQLKTELANKENLLMPIRIQAPKTSKNVFSIEKFRESLHRATIANHNLGADVRVRKETEISDVSRRARQGWRRTYHAALETDVLLVLEAELSNLDLYHATVAMDVVRVYEALVRWSRARQEVERAANEYKLDRMKEESLAAREVAQIADQIRAANPDIKPSSPVSIRSWDGLMQRFAQGPGAETPEQNAEEWEDAARYQQEVLDLRKQVDKLEERATRAEAMAKNASRTFGLSRVDAEALQKKLAEAEEEIVRLRNTSDDGKKDVEYYRGFRDGQSLERDRARSITEKAVADLKETLEEMFP